MAYTCVGYPLLLAALARWRPALPVRRDRGYRPTVIVLLVAHDEEACLERKLENLSRLDYPADLLHVVVASDGSTDGTEEIVRRHGPDGVRLVSLPGPRGKAAALAAIAPAITDEILVLCDARQELAPDAIGELVASFADPTVGAVSGELHIAASGTSEAGAGVATYWSYEKLVRRLESKTGSVVGATGALYAVRRRLFRPPDPRTILDDVAVPMEVVRAGGRVVFEPRARAYDRAAETAAAEHRRKVRTLAGSFQLVRLSPWLLHPGRNPLWWRFVSHKLARLAVPWCLAVTLGTAARLAAGSTFYTRALWAQLGLYGLAVAGALLARVGIRARFFAMPYAFGILNVAAATALLAFLSGRESAAWRGTRR